MMLSISAREKVAPSRATVLNMTLIMSVRQRAKDWRILLGAPGITDGAPIITRRRSASRRREMDEPRFCCAEMAVSFEQRQIYPSMDEDSGWNVRIDSFTDALTNIRFYCTTSPSSASFLSSALSSAFGSSAFG